MRTRRRFLATVVVLTVSIAACVGIEHLSSTAQDAVVLVGSNPIAFGIVEVGQTSAVKTITIAPASGSGDSNDTLNAVSFNCPDFTIDTSSLPAVVFRHCIGSASGTNTSQAKRWNTDTHRLEPATETAAAVMQLCADFDIATANFPATFHPSAPGSQVCTVSITGTSNITINLTGQGVLPPHQIDVQPGTIDFGDVRNNTQADVTFDIRNAGSQPLTIASVSVGAAPYSTDGTPVIVPVGGKTSFTASCHPTQLNADRIDAVTIVSDATNLPTVNIPLKCHAIDSPLAHNGPISMQIRAHESHDEKFTITNAGNIDAHIASFTLTGSSNVTLLDGFPAGTTPPGALTLNPGESHNVTLRYHTDAAETVDQGVSLAISHDGNIDNVPVQLRALATAFGTDASQTLEFGPVCAGTTASMTPVKVFAPLEGAFALMSVSEPGSPFTWDGATTGTATGLHTNDLTFMPSVTPTMAGLQTSTVTLTTDIPGDPTHVFMLSVDAKGLGATVEPQLTDYGPVAVTDVTAFKTVKFTNCTGHPVKVTDKRIEGEAPEDFKVVGPDPFERMLGQAETMEIQVVMAPQPTSIGLRNATLVVLADDGSETATALTGTATGADTGETGPATYYECNAGGSGGVFVGLAIGGLLIRRRRRR